MMNYYRCVESCQYLFLFEKIGKYNQINNHAPQRKVTLRSWGYGEGKGSNQKWKRASFNLLAL